MTLRAYVAVDKGISRVLADFAAAIPPVNCARTSPMHGADTRELRG